jgi:hypothetical protein
MALRQGDQTGEGRSLILRVFVRLGIGKWLMTFDTERHWETLVEMMSTAV